MLSTLRTKRSVVWQPRLLAACVASISPEFTPHVDTGDYIVVINAEKVQVTGNKAKAKTYYRHTGYPGGLRTMTFDKMLDHAPERIIEFAVKGMLPKGPLGRAMYTKLKVYAGAEHPHAAQQPLELNI